MQCFCAYQEEQEIDTATAYSVIDSEAAGIPICQILDREAIFSDLLGRAVAWVIIGVNMVLKSFIIKGITWVGEDTNSEQLSSITNGVFAA